MSKLVNLVLRMALWALFCAVVLVVLVWVSQNFFEGGPLGTGRDPEELMAVAVLGATIGAVIGFFRRN